MGHFSRHFKKRKTRNSMVHDFSVSINPSPECSKIKRSFQHKTTFNTGKLIPIYLDEVLPGDNFNIKTQAVVRQTTMIKPVMDTAYLDVMYFYVPWWIIWEDTKYFFGENDNPWKRTTEIVMPKTTSPADVGWEIGTVADYMGLPLGVPNMQVSSLPFRAYVKIWNDYFRDENLQGVSHMNETSSNSQGTNASNIYSDPELGGVLLPVDKYHDYFTSCLPGAQKGDPVVLNLASKAPVWTQNETVPRVGSAPLEWKTTEGQDVPTGQVGINALSSTIVGGTAPSSNGLIMPSNLWADLSEATSLSINELRQAFAYQQFLEKDARSGTRYVEFVLAHFGVNTGDSRLQRAEYLGGMHRPLNVQQIPQTNSTNDTTPQANLAAFGQTGFEHNSVHKTFVEHGYVIGVACVRYEHTYQQNLNRLWTRNTRFDIFDPIFAYLGEQPVKVKEIYYNKDNESHIDDTFGFNEYGADYRYKPNMVTGKFRSGTDSLDIWHYADNYKSQPMLSDEWIQEDKNNIDRTLAIQSDKEPQFIADFYFINWAERKMPLYSVPGLKRM